MLKKVLFCLLLLLLSACSTLSVKQVESEFISYRYGPMDLGIPYPQPNQGDDLVRSGVLAEKVLVEIINESESFKAKGYAIHCLIKMGKLDHVDAVSSLYETHEDSFRQAPDLDLSFMIGQACLYLEGK